MSVLTEQHGVHGVADSLAAPSTFVDAPGGVPPTPERARGAPGTSVTERLASDSLIRLQLALPCGRRVALGTRVLTVGKSARCDVVINDPSVSDVHCRVFPVRGHWEVRDAGSTNGTRVGNVRVEAAQLAPGLALVLGRTRVMVVRDPSEPVATASAVTAQGALVGSSASMEAVRDAIARYARSPYPVLIQGETGSGKELVARMLHERSPRARGPFVAVNAATIAPELVESELFGHEKGAFTGAHSRRRGVFEEASGGTLFLDELGELPLAQQAKLLRVLETGEVRRVGAEGSVRVDVRIVCATHRDLLARSRDGHFREDLYYRLNVLRVRLAPLRERKDDLPELARHLMARIGAELAEPRVLDDAAIAALFGYDWPGNVRQLYAVLRRAAVDASGERVGIEHLAMHEQEPAEPARISEVRGLASPDDADASSPIPPPPRLPRMGPAATDPAQLRTLLEACGGNVSRAAAAAGLKRSTFRDRLKRGG